MRPDPTRCLLLIDDEPAQRRLVAAIGARAGWWVRGANDLEQAREMAADPQEPKWDAILLDHWLPGEEGAALIREVKAIRPDLPLLVLTAQSTVACAVDAMRAGATDFLVKPIAPERLLAALNTATDRRRTTGELRPLSEKISKSLGFEEIVGSAPGLPRRARGRRQGGPRPRRRSCSKAKAARARRSSPRRSMPPPRAARSSSTSSIAARSPKISSNRCCSAMRKAASPAPSTAISAASRMPRARPCSSTRSASCRSTPRSNCCARSKRGEFQRLGSRITQTVDVRIIAATNRRLAEEVAEGPLPRGPLLPAQRRPRPDPAAARPDQRPARRSPATCSTGSPSSRACAISRSPTTASRC